MRTLYDCAKENDVEGIEALIAQGANVNEQFLYGETALLKALSSRPVKSPLTMFTKHFNANIAAATTLLISSHSSIDVNIADDYGNTPLYRAIEEYNGDLSLIILLLDRGADLNVIYPSTFRSTQGTSLHHVIRRNRSDLVHLF